MESYPVLADADVEHKRVLVRAGFDVPMKNGAIQDASRIEAVVPTIKYLLDQNASVIILSHQGRPDGVDPELSQKPIAAELEQLLGVPVAFASSCIGEETKQMVDDLAPGQVLLLENLRFDPREKKNDQAFAKELASYGEVYVNEAFPNSHRAHASMDALPRLLPSYMGLQLEEEITQLSHVLDAPTHPVCLVASGAKVETKLPLLTHFRTIGDSILTGGVMANTFLAAQGKAMGVSIIDDAYMDEAKKLLAATDGATIYVPSDVMAATARDAEQCAPVAVDDLPQDSAAFDIGPETIKKYVDVIDQSETIVWNGPLGLSDQARFAEGGKAVAQAMARATERGAVTIVGGGDTIDLLEKVGVPTSAMTFVSTAGGAMLDFLAGKTLPGLDALLHNA